MRARTEPYGATWEAWRAAAARIGNAVLARCPRWLIGVEGVGRGSGECMRYGGVPCWCACRCGCAHQLVPSCLPAILPAHATGPLWLRTPTCALMPAGHPASTRNGAAVAAHTNLCSHACRPSCQHMQREVQEHHQLPHATALRHPSHTARPARHPAPLPSTPIRPTESLAGRWWGAGS